MKLKNTLYKISRKINKTASILGDLEALASGSPKKTVNHFLNKTKNKAIYNVAHKISNKTNRRK